MSLGGRFGDRAGHFCRSLLTGIRYIWHRFVQQQFCKLDRRTCQLFGRAFGNQTFTYELRSTVTQWCKPWRADPSSSGIVR